MSFRGRHLALSLLPVWLLLAAPVPAASGPGSALLEAADLADLGRGWEVVRELPVDPSLDPDLVAWGVREQRARHYSRGRAGRTEVCSVEVWAFASLAQARAAASGFRYPDWQIDRVGSLLVMVRGLVRVRGGRPVRGVFPACETIGARVRSRAAELPAGRG